MKFLNEKPTFFKKTILIKLSLLLLIWSIHIPNSFAQTVGTNDTELITIDLDQLQEDISEVPLVHFSKNSKAPTIIDLPMLGNCTEPFEIWESPIMESKLAKKYPSIKTYVVSSIASNTTYGRLTVSHLGVHATILSPEGTISIVPEQNSGNNTLHKVSQSTSEEDLLSRMCGITDELTAKDWEAHYQREQQLASQKSFDYVSGDAVRTYRLASIATGEFYEANKDTGNGVDDDEDVTAVITSTVNGMQVFFDRDLAVQFTLLTPVLYDDYTTDPFQPDQEPGAPSRTTQARQQIHISFPTLSDYDVGHVFHNTSVDAPNDWTGGGVAGLGVVCNDFISNGGPSKARGWSGSFNNQTNGFISLAAHEFGHMFAASHTFNGTGNSCSTNISSSSAYEIASGITIMSYNGSCGAGQNIPSGGVADDYFHTRSLTQMINFINVSATCATPVSNGNTPPTVDANPCSGTYTIPISTPFELNGSGSDADGDPVTYTWEQYDEDGSGTPTQGFIGAVAAANAVCPLFRNFPPVSSSSRTFPALTDLVDNVSSDFEALPTVDRTINFRLNARDNNASGGGVACSALAIEVDDVGGPFEVTAPNDGTESWAAGSLNTVTWDVANTTAAPISCATVDIFLSIDGGLTYPYTLESGTANDGTQDVTIPGGVPIVSTARIRVDCATSTCVRFFDLSDLDFDITSDCLASSNYICPTETLVTVQGDASLMLMESFAYGTPTTSETKTITAANTFVSRGIADSQGSTACVTNNTRAYESFEFTVTEGGDYTFSKSSPGFLAVSIFEADGFDPTNPCASTFLGSNAYVNAGGGVSSFSPFTVTLTECTDYIVMMYASSNSYGSNTVNVLSGAGDVIKIEADPGADYDYTYVAVSQADGLIDVVSSSADFTSLVADIYDVYGASYKASGGGSPADVDPSTFVDQSLNDILGGGACVVFSSNSRQLIIDAPVPVELVSFTGRLKGDNNLLMWATASELNTEWHIIERSIDGRKEWTEIGRVEALGTSNKIVDYTLEDEKPMAKSYYRLRSVDFDRSEDISTIVYLERQSKSFDLIGIHPVPAKDRVTIAFENTDSRVVNLQVIDLLGRVIHHETVDSVTGVNTYQLDVSNWAAGVYFFTLDNGQEMITKRVVKD